MYLFQFFLVPSFSIEFNLHFYPDLLELINRNFSGIITVLKEKITVQG